ncbi:uncharacterized protein LOC134200018 [Bombyx mori]|uniref:uncharacterized protein LOC134200018 n=1 Tax=Bombyx mori TaxID=7091 RepID=UPI002ED5D5B6
MFFFQMLTVEILIVLSDNLSWGTFMSKNLIGVKFIARIMLISVCVSYLERELQKTKGLCNLAVRNCENDIVRCHLKNIYRIIDTEIEPMTVFGLFYINNVPLDLISLTATYTVVLLQFAFL